MTILYCGQESLRRNGVALVVNKRVQNAVLKCSLKNDRNCVDLMEAEDIKKWQQYTEELHKKSS